MACNKSRRGEAEKGRQLCCLFLHEALSSLWEHLWSAGNSTLIKCHGAGHGGLDGRDFAYDVKRRWMLIYIYICVGMPTMLILSSGTTC